MKNWARKSQQIGPASKVDFIAVDNPTATKFTIHILAAVAEHERDAISARTKAALAAAKAKGKRLGNYERIAAAKARATAARAEAMRPAITQTAHLSTRAAADMLNRRGIATANGKQWHAMSVHRARQRLGLLSTPGRLRNLGVKEKQSWGASGPPHLKGKTSPGI